MWHKKLFSEEFVGRVGIHKTDVPQMLGDHWHTLKYRNEAAGQLELTLILDGQAESKLERKIPTSVDVSDANNLCVFVTE